MAYVVYDDVTKNAMVDSLLVQIKAGKSMREVCRMDGMPDHTTVIRWTRISLTFVIITHTRMGKQ
jgi:hypothetical protein